MNASADTPPTRLTTPDLDGGLTLSLLFAQMCMSRECAQLIGDRIRRGQAPRPTCAAFLREGRGRQPYRAWAVVEFDAGPPLELPLDIWPFGAGR